MERSFKKVPNKENIYGTIFFILCGLALWYGKYKTPFHVNNIFKYSVAPFFVSALLTLISIKILDYIPKRKKELLISRKTFYVWITLELLQVLSLLLGFGYLNNFIRSILNIISIKHIIISGQQIEIALTLSLFIGYLFKIKIKDFNWNINLLTFLGVIFIFLVYFFSNNLIYGNTIKPINYYISFQIIHEMIYPGIYEEVLFRGFLMSGLLSFNMEKWQANIVQAIIFGLGHYFVIKSGFNFHVSVLVAIFYTSQQMILGYILGKIYLKTNSLLPGIIFHGLVDGVLVIFH